MTIFQPTLCKKVVPMGHAQNKIFFTEITKPHHKLSKRFILTKNHMFWLSYECFSISCDAFLLKSVISFLQPKIAAVKSMGKHRDFTYSHMLPRRFRADENPCNSLSVWKA